MEENELASLVHETLLSTDERYGLGAGLADKWEWDSATKVLTFQIRQVAAWSDGKPLTAKDVAFSLKRLLLLDRDKDLTLSQCVAWSRPKSGKIADVNGIVANGQILQLSLRHDCQKMLMMEMADSPYGIVHPSTVNNMLATRGIPKIVSGMFMPLEDSPQRVGLQANLHHWRWQAGAVSAAPRIEFRKLAHGPVASELGDGTGYTVIKTSDGEFIRSVAGKMAVRKTADLMTWYLTPADGQKVERYGPILADLNIRLDRSKIKTFQSMERATDTFFPPEYNCGPRTTGGRSALGGRTTTDLRLVSNPSGESKAFEKDLTNAIRTLGYRVSIAGPGDKIDERMVTLRIMRQFLGVDRAYLLFLLIRSFRTIPDPTGVLEAKFLDAVDAPLATRERKFTELCAKFHHYNHVPLARRQFALLAADPINLDLYSAVTGYLNLRDLPLLMLGKE